MNPRPIHRACIFALIAVAACSATPPAPPPATAPTPVAAESTPAPAAAPKIDLDRLDALLDRGDRAYKDGRLLTPIDDCAYDYYREALVVAPNHPAALHGLERVADRYVAMAEQAAEKGQFDTARKMLDRARIVDPDRESIGIAQTQIALRSTAQRQHVALDAEALAARDATVAAQLKALGRQAKVQNAWVVIRARTDAEGRWIYQQMASADGPRIRAELTLGPPAVDLLQLNDEQPPRGGAIE